MDWIKKITQVLLLVTSIVSWPTALAQDATEPSVPLDTPQNEENEEKGEEKGEEKDEEKDEQVEEGEPVKDSTKTAFKKAKASKSLSFVQKLYDKENRYYKTRWSESIFSKTSIEGINADQYRYIYRYHFPLFASVSLAPGFDISYLGTSETIGPYLDPDTGKRIQTEVDVKHLALALGARLQAGLDYNRLTFAPYLDYGTDVFAKSLVKIKDNDEFDGEQEDGGKNRRFVLGGNFYFNLDDISLGIGMEWGSINGDFGSYVGTKGIHFILRSGK